jgi:hypothetical protein
LHLYAFGALLAFVAARATPGGFGTPLAMKLETARVARELVASGTAAEVLVAGIGERPETDEFPAEFAALLAGTPHRFVDLATTALFPDRAAAVIVDERLNTPEGGMSSVYREAAVGSEEIALREDEGHYRVLQLPGRAAPAPEDALPDLLTLGNFVRLLGTDGPRLEGDAAVWQVHWRTADNPIQADYHLFNHLLDQDGLRVSQADAAVFSAPQWRMGDTVISRFRLPIPESANPPLSMRVGMYSYPDLTPVPVLDEAANPAGEDVRIPVELSEE